MQIKKIILYTGLLFFPLLAATKSHEKANGTFEAIDPNTPTAGTFAIKDSIEQTYLILNEDFAVQPGPDLHVILSKHALDEAINENASENGIILGLLKASSGTQAYAVDDSVSLEMYKSVLIHCVQYSHLFGGAKLLWSEITKAMPARTPVFIEQPQPDAQAAITVDIRGRRLPSGAALLMPAVVRDATGAKRIYVQIKK